MTYKELLEKCKGIKINKDHLRICYNKLGDYQKPDSNADNNILLIMRLFELKYNQAIKLIDFVQGLKQYKDLNNKEIILTEKKSSCLPIFGAYTETNYLLQINNLKYFLKL